MIKIGFEKRFSTPLVDLYLSKESYSGQFPQNSGFRSLVKQIIPAFFNDPRCFLSMGLSVLFCRFQICSTLIE